MPVKPVQGKDTISSKAPTKKPEDRPAVAKKLVPEKSSTTGKSVDRKENKEAGDVKKKVGSGDKKGGEPPEEKASNPTENAEIKLDSIPQDVSKVNRKRVVIPYVLPWENRPSIQNQHGMRAFGTGRNVFTPINQGSKQMPTNCVLKSESFLPLLADTHDLATQHGIKIGSFRDNVCKPEFGSKEIEKEKLLACQAIIPKQSGSNECPGQSGQTPMGALRHNVLRVQFRGEMTNGMNQKSKGFLTKFATPNPNSHAGSAVMDKIRKQVPDGMKSIRRKHSIRTEAILPKFQVRTGLDTCQGTGAGIHGLGQFRQTVTPVKGGYKFTEEEEIASKLSQPWVTSASLSSQRGTGGFQQRRDVVSNVKYQF